MKMKPPQISPRNPVLKDHGQTRGLANVLTVNLRAEERSVLTILLPRANVMTMLALKQTSPTGHVQKKAESIKVPANVQKDTNLKNEEKEREKEREREKVREK